MNPDKAFVMSQFTSLIQRMSLAARLIAIFIITLVVLLALNYVIIAQSFKTSMVDVMLEKASTVATAAEAGQQKVSDMHRQELFDNAGMVSDAQATRQSGGDYKDTKLFKSVPVVHGMQLAQQIAEQENVDLSIIAPDARNPDNQITPGSFNEMLFNDLNDQVLAQGGNSIHRYDDTGNLHFARAIRLQESCLACHGDPATSPTGDGKDILGFPMENLETGHVYAAYQITIPLNPIDQQVAGFIGYGLLWTVPLAAGAIVLILWMMRVIFARPISQLTDRLIQITNGDLTARIENSGDDELGTLARHFNQFVISIHDMVKQIGTASVEVASASTQIAASSEQLADGFTHQTQQVDDITASMQEMSGNIEDISNRSNEALQQANASGQAAQQGGDVVRETIAGMAAIRKAVDDSADSVEKLGHRGEEIGRLIGVINEIADQTNLLALNAAIEAARAGEHGRGFSVVADEVRKLADKTTNATDEVAQAVSAIQNETKVAVEQMHGGTQRVQEGVAMSERCGQSLTDIVAAAQAVETMIKSIASAAEQQAEAGAQITQSATNIAEVTRQSGEGTSQAVAAAQNLSQQAEKLHAFIGRYQVES